jgi:choline dehydrogenase-like flavoprotein
MRVIEADACVIGAGAGGAVAAKELAEGGMRVVVLEEGRHHPAATLSCRPREEMVRLYRDGGQTVTIGRPPIVVPTGMGVGGTTLVNSGTCFRTPDAVLARWRDEHGVDGLTPAIFARIEAELGVAPVPPELAGANAHVARRGAERLGWSGGWLLRNARGCQGSGVCAFGCPTGAKQHVGDTYLPKACAAGAITVTGARARRIVVEKRRATGVLASTAAGGLEVRAPYVVVAAGALHTPGLLARSGLGQSSGWLGRNLSIHPATAAWARMDEDVDMALGVPQSYYVDEFADERIMLEGIAGPPDYLAMAAPAAGDRHRELMLGHRRLAQFGVMVSDTGRGRVVQRLGRPLVSYDLAAADMRAFHTGLLRLAELFWAAGARSVLLPVARLPELHDGDSGPLERLELRAGDLKLMAFHPLGTARADANPERGVADARGRLHGVAGVYVADGSAVPGAPGVNPQITIMALATRLAFGLLESRVPEEVLACRS